MGRSGPLLKQLSSVFIRSMRQLAKCHPTVHLGCLQKWQTEGLAVRFGGEEFRPHTRVSGDQEGGLGGAPRRGSMAGLAWVGLHAPPGTACTAVAGAGPLSASLTADRLAVYVRGCVARGMASAGRSGRQEGMVGLGRAAEI